MDITNRDAFAIREFCARYGICRDTFYAGGGGGARSDGGGMVKNER
jgi:hypothetical protein